MRFEAFSDSVQWKSVRYQFARLHLAAAHKINGHVPSLTARATDGQILESKHHARQFGGEFKAIFEHADLNDLAEGAGYLDCLAESDGRAGALKDRAGHVSGGGCGDGLDGIRLAGVQDQVGPSLLAKANLVGEGSLTMVLAPIVLHIWATHCPIIPAPDRSMTHRIASVRHVMGAVNRKWLICHSGG